MGITLENLYFILIPRSKIFREPIIIKSKGPVNDIRRDKSDKKHLNKLNTIGVGVLYQ